MQQRKVIVEVAAKLRFIGAQDNVLHQLSGLTSNENLRWASPGIAC